MAGAAVASGKRVRGVGWRLAAGFALAVCGQVGDAAAGENDAPLRAVPLRDWLHHCVIGDKDACLADIGDEAVILKMTREACVPDDMSVDAATNLVFDTLQNAEGANDALGDNYYEDEVDKTITSLWPCPPQAASPGSDAH